MSLDKTHVIKKPRREQGPPHEPVPGGWGDEELCGFVRPDGQSCGLFVDDHTLVTRREGYDAKAKVQPVREVGDGTSGGVVLTDRTFGHWCQPSGYKLGDRQPCLYCGVPLVKVDGNWFYDDVSQFSLDQMGLSWSP
jgi:hypothetical protein